MSRLVRFIIPYDTANEKTCIINTLREYNNDENRIGQKLLVVHDYPFQTYKHKCKPRGASVLTWFMRLLLPVVEAHLELINDRLEVIQKRAYLVKPAMEKRIETAAGMFYFI